MGHEPVVPGPRPSGDCGCGCALGKGLRHEVQGCSPLQGPHVRTEWWCPIISRHVSQELHMADAGTPALAAAMLQVLWLADNQIQHVDGLATLLALRELNLAANPIATVGNAFVANTSLQQLNLADTHISSFKQVGTTIYINAETCQPRGSMLE